MKNNRNYLPFLLMFVCLFIFQTEVSAQCAMCKQAAETSMRSNPNSIARGLNTGILYLMAVPYLMIMFIFRKQIVQLWKSKFGKASKTQVEG